MADIYLKTENLAVGYGGKALIAEINLELKKSQIITLIGPNGSGKSTILKSLSQHLPAVGGNIYMDKQKIDAISGHELATKLSVVLTERIRPELMTCWDIVATGRYPYTNYFGKLTETDREIVSEAMQAVQALDLCNRSFEKLSDGQRQRILFARAICQQPELMILDEPTSFLDIRHKIELLEILRTMAHKKGITVVMSLHEIDLAQKISDYVVCVKGERIFAHGAPEDIFASKIIHELYSIKDGEEYYPLFNIELQKPQEKPEVFVVAGGGCATPFFRFFNRKGVPFYTGLLQKNDIDYYAAIPLADSVFADPAFEDLSDELVKKALLALGRCRYIVDCGCEIKQHNRQNGLLFEEAKRLGIEVLHGMKHVKEVFDE